MSTLHYKACLPLLILTMLIGCSVPRLPERSYLPPSSIPNPNSEKSRLLFYLGYLEIGFNNSRLDGADGKIFINDKYIGYINSKDAIVVDLIPGTYKISWHFYQGDLKDNHVPAPYELTAKAGEIIYLEANSKHVSNAGANAAGVLLGPIGGGIGASTTYFSDFFELEPIKGPQHLNDMKIVEFHNIPNQNDSTHVTTAPTANIPSSVGKYQTPPENIKKIKSDSLESRLIELRNLHDHGLITEEEYDDKRKALLNEM